MKSWKNAPHLFANGFFSVKTVLGKQQIQGISVGFYSDPEHYQQHEKIMYMLDDGDIRVLRQCTLIARPISDMTDEEIENLFDSAPIMIGDRYPDDSEIKEFCSDQSSSFIYLLSVGVYPFDQSHFDLPDDDPAKVIDATKIK